ncbi:14549_t:CDS:1, partial [Funneliformis geosporum]
DNVKETVQRTSYDRPFRQTPLAPVAIAEKNKEIRSRKSVESLNEDVEME